MKKNIHLIVLSIFTLFATVVNAQTSTTAPYTSTYACVNGSGLVWTFGEGKEGKGLYNNFNGWNFIQYNLAEGIKAASAGYGEILIVNNAGEIKEWNNNNRRWLSYTGISNVKDAIISKSNGNDKLAIGTVKKADGTSKIGVWKVANISTSAASWQEVLIDDWSKQFIKLANDKNGNLYFVTTSGRLMARYANDTRYSEIKTDNRFVTDILVGEDGALYIMERGGTIYKQNSSNTSWSPVKFSASSFGVDDKGNVYGVVSKKLQGLKNGSLVTLTADNPNKLDGNGNTPLTEAVVLNSEADVVSVIEKGGDVNVTNKSGETPLVLAAKNKNLAIVTILIKNNANPSIADQAGHTPLYYAVQASDKQMAQALLLGKMDANQPEAVQTAVQLKDTEMIILLGANNIDLTPGLLKAAELNDASTYKLLLDYGAQLTSNASFNVAADRRNTEIAALALQNGADVQQAVTYALQKSDNELIGVCLQNGASPSSVVDYAVKNNDVTLATALVQNYGVSADKLMERAVPGGKINSAQQTGTNLDIAAIALQNGANGELYYNHAVKSNNTQLAQLLLANGTNSNVLLEKAVDNQSILFGQLAIDNGAQPNSKPNLIETAVNNNDTKMVQLLINNGATLTNGGKLLAKSIELKNEALCQILLENGAPVSNQALIVNAVNTDNDRIVALLLEYGADPNVGMQPAIDKNKTEMVLMMIDAGAVATDTKFIASAATKGNLQIVTALVQSGAAPNEGVLGAINAGSQPVFDYLMSMGADNTNIDYVVATVRQNRTVMFKYLIDQGAPVAYKNASNENLLHLACRNDNYAIAEVLIRKGVDVNQKTNEGDTPLHIAANVGRNNLDVCTLLVDNGADVNASNNKGKSILKVADGKKLKDYLKSKGASK